MVRGTALAIVAGVFVLAFSGTAHAADLDCKHFDSQAEAQAKYVKNTSDPHGLDDDSDGVACESLGNGGGSGGESQAEDDSSDAGATLPKTGRNDTTPIIGAFAAFLLFAGAAIVSGARRTRAR